MTWRTGIARLREVGDGNEDSRQVNEMRQACEKAGIPAFE
jgi:hypothetical protein